MTGKHGGNVGLPDQTNSPFRSHTLIDIPPPPVFQEQPCIEVYRTKWNIYAGIYWLIRIYLNGSRNERKLVWWGYGQVDWAKVYIISHVVIPNCSNLIIIPVFSHVKIWNVQVFLVARIIHYMKSQFCHVKCERTTWTNRDLLLDLFTKFGTRILNYCSRVKIVFKRFLLV